MSSLFPPGQIVATPGALDALRGSGPALAVLLARHLSGQWGDLDAHDQQANDAALRDGSRLLSAYTLDDGTAHLGHHRSRPLKYVCATAQRILTTGRRTPP